MNKRVETFLHDVGNKANRVWAGGEMPPVMIWGVEGAIHTPISWRSSRVT